MKVRRFMRNTSKFQSSQGEHNKICETTKDFDSIQRKCIDEVKQLWVQEQNAF